MSRLLAITKSSLSKFVPRRVEQKRYEGFDKEWMKIRTAKRVKNAIKNLCPIKQAYMDCYREDRNIAKKLEEKYANDYYKYYKGGRTTECSLKLRKRKRKIRERVTQVWWGYVSDKTALSRVGCTVSVFTQHIESLLKEGWSRENYGTVWNFDHVKPCCMFDVFNEGEVSKLNYYTNIVPMCKYENSSKGSKDFLSMRVCDSASY